MAQRPPNEGSVWPWLSQWSGRCSQALDTVQGDATVRSVAAKAWKEGRKRR